MTWLFAALTVLAQADGSSDRQSNTYILSGRLTATSVGLALEKLAPNDHLIIRSGGGEVEASLDLGEAIVERNIRVSVTGYCLSGCAVAVLPAARRLVIAPHTIVGFHHSPIDVEMRYMANQEAVPEDVSEAARRLHRLYERAGVDIRILTCAAEQTGETLSRRWAINPDTGRSEQGWVANRSWWVVRDADLRHFGIKANFPPPTVPVVAWEAETRRRLQARFPDDIRFGGATEDCGRELEWEQGPGFIE